MADLLISRIAPGVVLAKPTDPFSTLEIYRIDRDSWRETPDTPGVYLLFGFVNGQPAVYIGKSTTSILTRVRTHHVTERKDWFGTLFAAPMPSAVLCQPVEAEMIRRVIEAGVVGFVDNRNQPTAFLDAADVGIEPAIELITGALEMLLGIDIFSSSDEEGETADVVVTPRGPVLARVYKGSATSIRPREALDPPGATHRWASRAVVAYGRFEGEEPDTRFRILAGSHLRRPTVVEDPSQIRLEAEQRALADAGAVDLNDLVFKQDYVSDNWSRAAKLVSGKSSYSGAYNWQRIG